jgi:hypothetical protein
MISRKFAAGIHFGPVDKWLLQREVFSIPARSTRKNTHQLANEVFNTLFEDEWEWEKGFIL